MGKTEDLDVIGAGSARYVGADVIAGVLGVSVYTVGVWGRGGVIPRVVISRRVVRYVLGDVLRALDIPEQEIG